ncbi:MAG: beta-ketoacyl synthase N-terminal-like domain-containing protein, partial [Candidatus Fermentibacteria bacterium]
MLNEHRVVITGLGAVTPIGIGVKDFYEGLTAGRNGILKVTSFDVTDFRSTLAGVVRDFHPEDWIDRKSARRMDRFT